MESKALTLTMSALKAPENLQGVFELEPFKNNFVNNFVKTTGSNAAKGELIFEREKILFMKAIGANKDLEKCDRFSIYSAFIELAVSGCSLLDGESYIIPYKTKAQFQVGYKGRINQMNALPGIVHVSMPQVVWSDDEFDYVLGEDPRIIKHKPVKAHAKDAFLTHVYLIVQREPVPGIPKSKDVYIMDREEVLSIRDRYSQSWKNYRADCEKLGKKIGDTFQKEIQGNNGPFKVWVEPPMWVTSEQEAWKKTITKRAYKWVPKTPRLKALDAKIANNLDPEDGSGGEEDTHDINYGIITDDGTAAAELPAATKPAAEKPAAPAAPAAPKASTKKDAKKSETPAPTKEEKKTPTAADDINDIANAETQDVQHEEIKEEQQTPDLGDPLKGF